MTLDVKLQQTKAAQLPSALMYAPGARGQALRSELCPPQPASPWRRGPHPGWPESGRSSRTSPAPPHRRGACSLLDPSPLGSSAVPSPDGAQRPSHSPRWLS